VLVRSNDGVSRFLGPGDAWRSDDRGAPPASSASPAPQLAPPSNAVPSPQPAPASNAVPAHTPRKAAPAELQLPATSAPEAVASELAAQTRLLEAAELAQKSGLTDLALERFETLVARYPDSELAHNARVQRLRLLRSQHRDADAAAAAQDYLAHYPQGFAREEAERVLHPSAAAVP
jgi:TolA-binding protein